MERRSLVAGVGINDADYVTQRRIDGRHWMCPVFAAWKRMINSGHAVHADWFRFSNFRHWMVRRKWQGKVLDRWLYGDGITYSPEHCCFLDRQSSTLAHGMNEHSDMGVDRPHGETLTRPYRVTFRKHIGYYQTYEQAREVWCNLARAEFKRLNSNRAHREAVDHLYAKIKTLSE